MCILVMNMLKVIVVYCYFCAGCLGTSLICFALLFNFFLKGNDPSPRLFKLPLFVAGSCDILIGSRQKTTD
jgi:uncharacterized membrane protein